MTVLYTKTTVQDEEKYSKASFIWTSIEQSCTSYLALCLATHFLFLVGLSGCMNCVNSVFSMRPQCLHSLHPVARPLLVVCSSKTVKPLLSGQHGTRGCP